VSNAPQDNQRLLSSFNLGPSWARDAIPRKENRIAKSIENNTTKESIPRERHNDRKFSSRRNDKRDFSRNPQNKDRPPERTFINAAPGVKVMIDPSEEAINLIAKEIAQVARVYSLFDIAKTLLDKRERFVGTYTVNESQPAIFHGHRDHSLWLTKEEAIAHLWNSEWFTDLYEQAEVETEGPKGNFQVIAKCGISGTVLGPPNYHAYQITIRNLHKEKFAADMPFDQFAASIITERSEEAVVAWVASMTTATRWRPIGQEESDWLIDKKAVENHFVQNRFSEMYVETRNVKIPAFTSGKLQSPQLLIHLKKSAFYTQSHPAIIIPSICTFLDKAHVPVFKKQGKLYSGPARPHPIPHNTSLSDRPAKIVTWLTNNPEKKLTDLWQAVLPNNEKEPTDEWLSDLFWLLSQGHVLLFADDSIVLPVKKQPLPEASAQITEKAKKPKKAKKKKRRLPRLMHINKRVAAMSESQQKQLRGFERTVSHRLRLKSKRATLRRTTEEEQIFTND
jgi:hypothetical protein